MKRTKKTNTGKSRGVEDKIKRGFIEYILENDKKPGSVFKLCKTLGLKEDDFYLHFGSLQALEKSIWHAYVEDTLATLKGDANYQSFSSREKLLSFYFTFLETIRSDREFIAKRTKKWKVASLPPRFLNQFRKRFDEWAAELIAQGKANDEIGKRPLLDRGYPALLWFHLHFIIQFWVRDDSKEFEKTDMAIEKSVNLAFDVIGKGILDNALDFGKFLFQQSRG